MSDVEIIPRGGLRLGRRWSWLAGASPTLLVAGFDPGEAVRIDGELVQVSNDGAVSDEGRLARPGVHLIAYGRLRRRVEIVEPDLAATSIFCREPLDDELAHVIALPRGTWTIVGSRPGDAAWTSGGLSEGVLLTCAFDPV